MLPVRGCGATCRHHHKFYRLGLGASRGASAYMQGRMCMRMCMLCMHMHMQMHMSHVNIHDMCM